MTNGAIIPHDLAVSKFHNAMQLFVGRGRRWSCTSIAEATGIPLRTVESYRSGQAGPSLENYQALCAVMGEAFFAATIEHMPFDVRTTEPADITAPKLLSEVLCFGSHLAQALEDGRIDHREAAELKERLADFGEMISGMKSSLETGT